MATLAASWGLIAVLVGAVDLDAETLAFARLSLAALTLLVVASVTGRAALLLPGSRLPALIALGVVQGAHWLLFFEAVKLGSVALAVLTFYTAPLLIALAAPVALRESVSNVALGALVPGTIGVVLVALVGGGDDGSGFSAVAIAAGLGSGATYAVLVVLSKRLLAADTEPLTVAFWDCVVGGLVVLPFLVLAERVVPHGREWPTVLLLGVVFTGLSTLAYAALLRHVTAQAAGTLTFLEPLAAVGLAALFLDDPLDAVTVGGGALVLLAGLAVVVLEPSTTRVADVPAPVGSDEP